MSIQVTDSGLTIDGRPVPLLSGSMHYWRVEREHWSRCLTRVKALGFQAVCTYIPWSVHELRRGEFDFGEIVPEKDVAAFIRLAGEMGLYVMVRPGPHINAEITGFGFPARVLDDPAVQACGPQGEPIILPILPKAFPVPSYCSEKFWEEVAVYFDAVAKILKPLIHPRGPVILVQCDNENTLFFRTGAYEQDYSDGALAAYHRFLEDKHLTPDRLSEVYHRKIASWNSVLPPAKFEAANPTDIAAYLDWAEFKERIIGDSLLRVRQMWIDRGIDGVLFTHNVPPPAPRTPSNIPRDERVLDLVGMDHYPQRKDYAAFRTRVLCHEGQSRLPWSPEFTSGAYLLWPPITLADQEFMTHAALMHGLKGFNFYMLVERERWYGSPINRHGEVREKPYRFYEELVKFIRDHRLFKLEREAPAMVLTPRLYDRLEKAAALFGRVPPMIVDGVLGPEALCSERTLGFRYCVQIEHDRMRRAFMDGLFHYGAPLRWGDSESGLTEFSRHPFLFCPTFEFMDENLQRDLAAYVEMGGTLVMGPEVPGRDEFMRELATLGGLVSRPTDRIDKPVESLVFQSGAGTVVLVTRPLVPESAEARQTVARIADYIGLRPLYPVSPPCDRTVFRGPGRTVVYIANPTDDDLIARLACDGAQLLEDIRTGERFQGEGRIHIAMRPWQIRVLEKCS